MIEKLAVGMDVLLPSGNVVVLKAKDKGLWACEYTSRSRLRGEVEFSAVYLQRFGETVVRAKVLKPTT
jgi:hypothetical protein